MSMDLSRHFPHYRHSRPALNSVGQPKNPTWRGLTQAGVCMLINLRATMEMLARKNTEAVHSAGLTCVNVPTDGADRIGREAGRQRGGWRKDPARSMRIIQPDH